MDSIADSLAALSLLVAIGSLVYQQRRQRAWEKKQEARQYPEIEVMSDPLFQQDHPTWLDVASTMTLRLRAAGQDRATHISVALFGCETYLVPETFPPKRMDGMQGLYWAGDVSLLREGEETDVKLWRERHPLRGTMLVGTLPLHAPEEPSLLGYQTGRAIFYCARCTVTFRDRDGRKHAGTFDYHATERKWERKGF